MIRVAKKEAVAQIQAVLVSMGAIPLDATDDGLIVITPEQFRRCIDEARAGAVEAHCAEEYYARGPQH